MSLADEAPGPGVVVCRCFVSLRGRGRLDLDEGGRNVGVDPSHDLGVVVAGVCIRSGFESGFRSAD